MHYPSIPRPALTLSALCLLAAACADGTAPSPVQVAVEPATSELVSGQTQQFTASVAGTNIAAVNWTADGGTITSGGLYTAGSEPGSYTVTATSTVSQDAKADAQVFVTQAGLVIPIWNRSRAYAGAAANSQTVTADSADFSGFEAAVFASSSTGSASTDMAATFHREAATGHLYLIESESSSTANNTFPADGTPNASSRLNLLFEVRHAPVSIQFTALCTFWGFDARLARTSSPRETLFEVDIMEGEFADGECGDIDESEVLAPGTYDLEVTHTFNTPWMGMEPGSSVSYVGDYTMRLEFDQSPGS